MAAQAMRNQRNVSGITVTDLTLAMADDFAQAGAAAEAFAQKTASATTNHEHENIPPTLSQVETDLPVWPVERSSTLNTTNELQEETPAQELVILSEDTRPSEGPRQPPPPQERFYVPTHPEFNDCSQRLEPETTPRATA
jgi:hypothetical protein